MPIPMFDANGNLPVGDLFDADGEIYPIVHASFAEIYDRFVAQIPTSQTRQRNWDGWIRHRRALDTFGIPYVTLVDGSFATNVENPNDIDCCIILDASDLNRVPQADRDALSALFVPRECKIQYHCDPYPIVVHPFGHRLFTSTIVELNYWTRVFGIDRAGNQKSILLVTEPTP